MNLSSQRRPSEKVGMTGADNLTATIELKSPDSSLWKFALLSNTMDFQKQVAFISKPYRGYSSLRGRPAPRAPAAPRRLPRSLISAALLICITLYGALFDNCERCVDEVQSNSNIKAHSTADECPSADSRQPSSVLVKIGPTASRADKEDAIFQRRNLTTKLQGVPLNSEERSRFNISVGQTLGASSAAGRNEGEGAVLRLTTVRRPTLAVTPRRAVILFLDDNA
ncbi:hypothetical protein EVAR_50416_1 [Eumeta japonica]|uniref:Uncharacterized protein n=1 Tax=Eumeta variegata TaxID=151549 RepID=A0A4C1WWF7_EUMVA|nr:hypothetical protein EVAR_50416_1 [Eumeta japonica]